MKPVAEMIQNTNEWLELRLTRIGASEANIIMNVSKFSTPAQLLEYKINPESKKEKDNTYITDKGHRLEEKMRNMLEIETGLDFPPIVALSENYDFLMASLDGYNAETNTVAEFKYVGVADFEIVKSGKHLEQYYPQVQQQMLVTKSKKCILMVCKEIKERCPETQKLKVKNLEYAKTEVDFDANYVEKKLIPALAQFWQEVLKAREAKTEQKKIKSDIVLTDKDIVDQSSDKEMVKLIGEYAVLNDEVSKVSARLSDIKADIFKRAVHSNVICGGVKIQKIQVKGRSTTDYAGFIKSMKLVVPQEFIKVGNASTSHKITFPKDS